MVKQIVAGAILLFVVILMIVLFAGCSGSNDVQTYQIKQSLGGTVDVIDKPGWYNKGFATVYTYPRSVQAFFSAHPQEGSKEDESIRVHFNDGGTAKVSVMVQFQLPVDADKRKLLHQTFANVDNVKQAVRAHLINCVKNTGPMMSATDNQAGRKGEFNQVVEEQLRKGIYAMRRVTVEIADQTMPEVPVLGASTQPAKPQPIRVQATEIVKDAKTGEPLIVEKSPLAEYGITIQQFSITGVDYDDPTIQQFAAKQKAILASESAKAEREKELQQTATVVQQGLRQKAEIEASENVKKAQQVIQAEAKAEVAQQAKLEAETLARQKLAVAQLDKDAAETKAQQDLQIRKTAADAEAQAVILTAEAAAKAKQMAAQAEAQAAKIKAEQELAIAQLKAQQSAQEAQAIENLAKAEQKKIELSGALSEKDRLSMELESRTRIGVAEAVSKVQVPATIINGGDSKGGNVTENLLNISLLRALGIVPDKHEAPAAPKKTLPVAGQ
jgi:regulator of protease activity HflC (stomatin/prohibitin superfamily)